MIGAEMAALAERFAAIAGDAAFDFSLASLEALDALVGKAGKARVCEETTRAWGAYLGETIRRRKPDAVVWVDRATAAAANAMVAELQPGHDIEAILRVGPDGYWFPLSKVEKRQINGPTDNLAAFAGVLLASLAPPSRDEPVNPDNVARAREALSAFREARTDAALSQFVRTFFTSIAQRHHRAVLAELGVTVDELWPFLAHAPAVAATSA
jgi:hypothetical protein